MASMNRQLLMVVGTLVVLAASTAAPASCLSPATPSTGGPLQLNYQDTGSISTICATPTTPSSSQGTSWTYADTFPAQSVFYTSSSGTQFSFYDDYVFTIGPATADSVTSTVSLGSTSDISNLEVRLYGASGNPSLPVPKFRP